MGGRGQLPRWLDRLVVLWPRLPCVNINRHSDYCLKPSFALSWREVLPYCHFVMDNPRDFTLAGRKNSEFGVPEKS